MGLAEKILPRLSTELSEEEMAQNFFSHCDEVGSLLKETPGFGSATQARILAALDLARRYHESMILNSRKNAATDLSTLEKLALDAVSIGWRAKSTEWFGFVPIYSEHRVGQLTVVAEGSKHAVHFEMSQLFRRLITINAKGFIAFHNHPGGSINPTKQDLMVTREITNLADRLSLNFLSHLIITKDRHVRIEY